MCVFVCVSFCTLSQGSAVSRGTLELGRYRCDILLAQVYVDTGGRCQRQLLLNKIQLWPVFGYQGCGRAMALFN